MAILDILEEKITTLNNILEQVKTSDLNKKQKLEAELIIIEECERVLNSEELMMDYDFSNSVSILNNQNLTINNVEHMLSEVKQVINVKRMVNIPELEFSEEQKNALIQLKKNLETAKHSIKKEIAEISKKEIGNKNIENLEELRNILAGTSKKKYYTEEMFDAFSELVDWEKLSDEEFDSILSGFYNTRNFQREQKKEKENIDNVISLYKEFLPERDLIKNQSNEFSGLFGEMIYKYQEEITSYIDLDNTREILQFFKETGILNKFNRTALLKVSIFAESDYVKELYHKIQTNHPEEMDIYYEDATATLWICNSTNYRRKPFRVSIEKPTKKEKESLYSQCHSITEDEFRENVKVLSENSDMFSEKLDISNIGAHLKVKTMDQEKIKKYTSLLRLVTTSSWQLVKNLQLFKLFKMGENFKIPITSLERGDIENKIHLAIELGLLNPPMDSIYREIEKNILTSESFSKIASHRRIYNNSIRNYFQRNTSIICQLSINDYSFLFYKLNKLGPTDFYNYFFHEKQSGRKDTENIKNDIEKTVPEKTILVKEKRKNVKDYDQFIRNNFVIDYYNEYIENYEEYDYIITNYNEENKKSYNQSFTYYDNEILKDELIKELEEKNCIEDILTQNNQIIKQKNEFVYKIGNTLISRYKVLHNASILKRKYGYLNKEMLMTSIVRNSFLTKESFETIEKIIYDKRGIKR